jgi:hypothetical protein
MIGPFYAESQVETLFSDQIRVCSVIQEIASSLLKAVLLDIAKLGVAKNLQMLPASTNEPAIALFHRLTNNKCKLFATMYPAFSQKVPATAEATKIFSIFDYAISFV